MERPTLTTEEALAVVKTKTAPRITRDGIAAKIAQADYFQQGVMTICAITMANGFTVIGNSAPASAENFDADVGRRLAYDDAFRKLWPLEGYLLRERLAEAEAPLAERLRAALRAVIVTCGGIAEPETSDDFLFLAPEEVRAVMKARGRERATLAKARAQFLFYEQQHRAKGTEDADRKAEVNRALAAEIQNVLDGIEAPDTAHDGATAAMGGAGI